MPQVLHREPAVRRHIQNGIIEGVGRIEVDGRRRVGGIRITLSEDIPKPGKSAGRPSCGSPRAS